MSYIIESIKYVVDNAKYVNINEEAIFEFCEGYKHEDIELDLSLPFPKKKFSKEENLAFHFILESIGFSTWGEPKWFIVYKNKEVKRGTSALIATLYRAIDEGYDILNSKFLSNLTLEQVKHIFRGNVEIPLLKERHLALVELGTVISKRFDNSFLRFVEKSNYDVKSLLNALVSNFSIYKDESKYDGEKVYFYKLAQLLINDIILLFPDKKFTNTEILTGLADYKIPYILHSFGILEYRKELTQKLEKKEELVHNSEEEIEIRAAMVMVVNLMYFILKNRFPDITLSQLNNYLWLNANSVSKNALPHHRTRSVYY